MRVTPKQRMLKLTGLIFLSSALALPSGCKRDDGPRAPDAAPTSKMTPSPSAKPTPSTAERESKVVTASGDYVVYYTYDTAPDPVPLNEMFSLDIRIENANGRALGPDDIALRVDAAMPQHGHGMNTTPRIESVGNGFHVTGMLLHMPGDWRIYFDVTHEGMTDRATVDVSIE